MVALTDMTVQYTVLVDAHIPRLAACLADPNELVRRQALALLASLLSRVGQPPPLHTLRCSMPQASSVQTGHVYGTMPSQDCAQSMGMEHLSPPGMPMRPHGGV